MGVAVADTDPGQARACLRESRELSAALGYQSALDLVWAAAIAFLVGDQTATLELGRRAIRGLQWGSGLRMGYVLYIIAGALAATRPDAAAVIQGAAEAYLAESPKSARLISSTLTEALGDERARELRARGAGMDWDQALATPSPRPPRPSRNSNPGRSHERPGLSSPGRLPIATMRSWSTQVYARHHQCFRSSYCI